jgi:RNA polymerase sigma-70 factor (ECF subfamily)
METTFEAMIEAQRPALDRAALKFCHGDFDLAQDMVQDTMLKALRNGQRFTPGTNLRAWLIRILYNTVMSRFRHRQVARENPYPEGFDPEVPEAKDLEVSDEVSQALNELPEDYRKVFLMAALEDSPYQEIADKLGIPVGTVMSRLWRARQSLQRRLSPVEAN